MPVVINTVEVTPEQPRSAIPEPAAGQTNAPVKPSPEEIRRQLELIASRLTRLQAH